MTSTRFTLTANLPRLRNSEGTIAHGMMVAATISEMMTAAFGENWLRTGKMKIRFRSPVKPGQRVTAQGNLRRIIEDGDATPSRLRRIGSRRRRTDGNLGERLRWRCKFGWAARIVSRRLSENEMIGEWPLLTSDTKMVRIALDAMGGDNAPQAGVEAAVRFAAAGSGQVMLVGDPDAVGAELAKYEASRPSSWCRPQRRRDRRRRIARACAATEAASLDTSSPPARSRPAKADACVTMGSTGAAMAASAVLLGMAKGVERPALGGPIVGVAPNACIIDLGTNVDCRPRQLLSFGAIRRCLRPRLLRAPTTRASPC